jgi:hypothetical protein
MAPLLASGPPRDHPHRHDYKAGHIHRLPLPCKRHRPLLHHLPFQLIEHYSGLYLLAKPDVQAAVRLLDINLFEHAALAAYSAEHPVVIDYTVAIASLTAYRGIERTAEEHGLLRITAYEKAFATETKALA